MGERIAGGRLTESLARLAELRDAMGLDGASYRSVLGRFVAHIDAGWPEAGSLTREMVDGYLALHPG